MFIMKALSFSSVEASGKAAFEAAAAAGDWHVESHVKLGNAWKLLSYCAVVVKKPRILRRNSTSVFLKLSDDLLQLCVEKKKFFLFFNYVCTIYYLCRRNEIESWNCAC